MDKASGSSPLGSTSTERAPTGAFSVCGLDGKQIALLACGFSCTLTNHIIHASVVSEILVIPQPGDIMAILKCRYCKEGVLTGTRHHCKQMQLAKQPPAVVDESEGNFFLSFAVAAATDNWAIGTLVGGNLLGGIVGDAAVGNNDSGNDGDSGSDD